MGSTFKKKYVKCKEMETIGVWATVAMSAALLAEKIVNRFNLYDGVRSLHMNCSRCCDVDIQRTDRNIAPPPPPPPLPTASPVPERAPTPFRENTPTIEELMRRVSVALVEKEKIPP